MGLEQTGVASSAGASLMEVSAFMKEQLKEQRDHDEKVRKEMEAKLDKQRLDAEAKLEAQKKDAEAKLEAQRQQVEAQKKEADTEKRAMQTKMEALCDGAMEARVRDAQLHGQQVAALQIRLEAVHAAKLLSDEELFALEDAIADADEAPDGDGRVVRMVALSVRMSADAAFSRQLRRKFM